MPPPTPRSLLIMLIIDNDNRWFIDNVKCIIKIVNLQLFGKNNR